MLTDGGNVGNLTYVVVQGTEKYPDENEYSKFLSEHGGGSNAYTASQVSQWAQSLESSKEYCP